MFPVYGPNKMVLVQGMDSNMNMLLELASFNFDFTEELCLPWQIVSSKLSSTCEIESVLEKDHQNGQMVGAQ